MQRNIGTQRQTKLFRYASCAMSLEPEASIEEQRDAQRDAGSLLLLWLPSLHTSDDALGDPLYSSLVLHLQQGVARTTMMEPPSRGHGPAHSPWLAMAMAA